MDIIKIYLCQITKMVTSVGSFQLTSNRKRAFMHLNNVLDNF